MFSYFIMSTLVFFIPLVAPMMYSNSSRGILLSFEGSSLTNDNHNTLQSSAEDPKNASTLSLIKSIYQVFYQKNKISSASLNIARPHH